MRESSTGPRRFLAARTGSSKTIDELVSVVVRRFFPDAQITSIQPLAGGLINHTLKVGVRAHGKLQFAVLQKLNKQVFTNPHAVMNNHIEVARGVRHDYPLEIPALFSTDDGEPLTLDSKGDYWRMYSYLENTVTYYTPPTSDTIYQAAEAYGAFLYSLRALNPDRLEQTIPHFHDLAYRISQLQLSLCNATEHRRMKSQHACDHIMRHYSECTFDFSQLPIRAVHNDCKLANLLFDQTTGDCRAVVDFDTVMAGVTVTDFGDMVRSLCSTESEEETSLDKVRFDPDRYVVLKNGFLKATDNWLTPLEKSLLFDGAVYIVLEQATRFLLDYLDNDSYYGCSYADHNYHRACNQLALLTSMRNQRGLVQEPVQE